MDVLVSGLGPYLPKSALFRIGSIDGRTSLVPGETSFVVPALPRNMDPVVVFVAIGLAILIFFLYLMARRTFLGFQEGIDRKNR